MDRAKEVAQLLGITEEEAKEVLECDKRIDKGEKLFEQTDEQKKATKEMTLTGAKKKPTVYKFEKPKERKVDTEKSSLAQALYDTIEKLGAKELDIMNEREINFVLNDRRYRVSIAVPRK